MRNSKHTEHTPSMIITHVIYFRIRQIVYNLESKSNIELDLGKQKKHLEL